MLLRPVNPTIDGNLQKAAVCALPPRVQIIESTELVMVSHDLVIRVVGHRVLSSYHTALDKVAKSIVPGDVSLLKHERRNHHACHT